MSGHLLNSGYDLSDLYSKATERFAYLGAKLFDKSGQIPIELIPFYKEFINVPPPPTFNTKDPFDIRNIYPLGSHGKGGPGFHDGVGGLGSIFGGLWGSVKNVFAKEKNTESTPTPAPTPTYNIRGMNINDDDIKEAANILYGEISNRNPDRQKFEIKHIINTAINRSQSPSTDPSYGNLQDRGKGLVEILQRPAQYQSYAPEGIIGDDGKWVESQYQKVKKGDIDEFGQKKLQLILDTLNELKSSGLTDTTGGSMYYVHASDGTLWLGNSPKEAKALANKHERKNRIKVSQYGTAIGMPTPPVLGK